MPCYFPLQVFAYPREDGKKSIVFSKLLARCFYEQGGIPSWLKKDALSLPCGSCIGCRLERSRQWAVRCVHEAKCHEENCFVTLTYAPEYVPQDGSLFRKDVQDFLKRLRRMFDDRKIRVFYCGEYGDDSSRPHYHLCLFNFDFPDKEREFKLNGNWIYTSEILEDLWSIDGNLLGRARVGAFSFETAAYVARYCMKKINGPQASAHYGKRVPEFSGMSLKPGIGKTWFDKYSKSDLFPHDNVVVKGTPCKPPRYYDVLRERVDPVGFLKAKEARHALGEDLAEHSTFRRLQTRLKCHESKIKLLVRRLESGQI